MRPKIHYPWAKTPVGGGFFVPSLTLLETKADGLRAALHHNQRGTCAFGIRGGMVGVLFTRTR